MYLNIIGEKLKKRRKEKEITQTKLSRITGVSQSMISGLEGGKTQKAPSAEALSKIAEALEVDFEYFFDELTESSLRMEEDKYLDQGKIIDVVPFYRNEETFLSYYLNNQPAEEYRCLSNHLNISVAVGVSDDAMFPFFLKDDCVFISEHQNINNEDIGLFIYRSKSYIRQYIESSNEIVLKAFNPAFSDLIIEKKDEGKLIKIGRAPFFYRQIEGNHSYEDLLKYHIINA